MKLIIIISSVLFLCSSIVSGQTIAFADYPVTDYTHFNDNSYVAHHRRHSITTRIGEGIMIGAGVFIVTGGAYSLLTTDSGDLGGALLLVGGQFLAGVGGIVFGCGSEGRKSYR